MRASPWLWGALGVAVALYLYSRTDTGQATVASIADTVGDLVKPRGIRNNNPGNIVRSSIQWQGSIPADQVSQVLGVNYDPTFEQFVDASYGVRAIGHVLLSKQSRGLSTVDAIIRDYSSTDQAAYIANVSQALNVDPQQEIDVGAVLPAFAAAIIQQENGQQPYQLSDIANWVYS